MSSVDDIVLLLALFSFVLLFFIVFQQLATQKLKSKIAQQEKDLREKEEIIQKTSLKTTKKDITPNYPATKNSLYFIKKIESLESALALQKKRVLETKAIAQEANRVKSEFLSNIRHEIRTPMNSIMVFSDLLAQETMDEKLKSYTKNISVASHKLLELLDDIIELSSVEGGAFEIEESPVDIRKLLNDVIQKVEDDAKKKALSLTVYVSDQVPDTLLLDKEKVEDILTNLIENAIKFTDKGFVKIELEVNQKNILKNAVNLKFTIQDSGVGIEDKYLERLFEIFEKPDSDDEKIRGAGLGLSINKKLAQAMHGDISVRSKLHEGSTFVFTLQNVEVALANANTKEFNENMIDFSLIKTQHNKVVVIDKDEESSVVLREAFAKTPIEVYVFQEPRDAIAFLHKESVDVIYIDIGMLTEDDNAVAKILMKISSATIVTLTSHRIKDVVFAHGIKIAGHLMRPISFAELFKTTLKAVSFTEKNESKDVSVIVKENDNEISNLQKEAFLKDVDDSLEKLYSEAYKTNDLESIEAFANALYTTAKKHNLSSFEDFGKTLIQKIELFDIDAMHSMMQEYSEKIKLLKNS